MSGPSPLPSPRHSFLGINHSIDPPPSDHHHQHHLQQKPQQPASPRDSFSYREHSSRQLQPQLRSSISNLSRYAFQPRGRRLTKRVSFYENLIEPTRSSRDRELGTIACSNEVMPFACKLPLLASDRQEQSAEPVMPEPCAALPPPGTTAHAQLGAAALASPFSASQASTPFDSKWTPFGSNVVPPAIHPRFPSRSRSVPMLPATILDEDEGTETQREIPGTAA
mmetsp:Transcript_26427/g.71440  ORF Transcript_26427/g.71440 Transcript_26427/m.71440 type:complete len:224 (-) Transcript_26427:1631-2302(-)